MNLKLVLLLFAITLLFSNIQGQEKLNLLKVKVCDKPSEESDYLRWLERDVLYIVTPIEKETFLTLKSNADREQFINNFWQVRDLNLNTEVNEFREEHYQRIAYANEHLQSERPGWTTDRGKIYILNGKPDKIETGQMKFEGIQKVPFEKWYYKDKDFINSNSSFTFVNLINTKEFRLIQN